MALTDTEIEGISIAGLLMFGKEESLREALSQYHVDFREKLSIDPNMERKPKAITNWIKDRYPQIHKQAKKEKAEIHWGDEMGLRSDHQAGRTYGRKGQTPVIPKSGKRFGCNMISTITNNGKMRFMIYEESFAIPVFLKFLRRLINKAPRKIFLILDNHKVHHAKKITKWLENHKNEIEIFFFACLCS